MFWKKEAEKRSIEDIMTPREESVDEHTENIDFESKCKLEESCKKVDVINPLDCFGMEDGKTEKWLMKCVKFWYCIMSFFWFLFGATTFAPVIYISNKLMAIFKSKTKALVCAFLLYSTLIIVIVLAFAIRLRNANAS